MCYVYIDYHHTHQHCSKHYAAYIIDWYMCFVLILWFIDNMCRCSHVYPARAPNLSVSNWVGDRNYICIR